MLAGAATLRCMDEAAYAHLDGIGSRFASGVRRVAADTRAPLQISGVGSIYNLHFAPEVPRTPAMAFGDRRLLALLHLRLLTDGVLTGERGYFCFSAVTTAEEIDEVVEKINAALVWMRPAIEETIEVFKQSLLDLREKGQI
jgi:glutamate-1-semialdehyde 2,1-aminomutase